MRSRTSQWFECKIAFDKVMEDGLQKKVTEKYVVNALSHSEAEERITEEMSVYISGEFDVKGIVPAQYKEIFFMSEAGKKFINEVEEMSRALNKGDVEKADEVFHRPLAEQNNTDTRWYKAKVQFLTLDEKTEKEKRTTVHYLVEACSVHNACENIDATMKGSMADYVIVGINEQPIIDVFEQTAAESKATDLMARMAEDLRDRSVSVESIVDKYVHTATPELRQQLIDKLTQMRDSGQVPEKE